jgi:hypothetical protein
MVATTGTSDPTRGRRPLTAQPLLLDQFLPTYDLAIVFSRVFRAPPERCLETVVDSNLFEIPLFRVLIGARGLSQRLVEVVRPRGEESRVPSARRRSYCGTWPRSAGSNWVSGPGPSWRSAR